MDTNNRSVIVKGLEKKFGDFVAVNKISFEVKPGEIFGFLGPNGAGKSTTIRMLCGILMPTSGSGFVSGFDITRQQEEIKEIIGYMSQRFSLYDDLKVEENIDFYAGIYKLPARKKKERKEWIIEMSGLSEMRTSLARVLSVGWKQRLALGCAIIHEPKIVFLDEPTSGVDPIARKNFWALIKEMAKTGVTVFVTTHYMDEAENCDRAALIYNGTIISMGTPAEMKSQCVKEDFLEIIVAQPEEWLGPLSGLEMVKEAALFGSSVHVAVSDAREAMVALKELFSRRAVKDYSVSVIKPSLEDAFVSLIESYDKKGSICEPYQA